LRFSFTVRVSSSPPGCHAGSVPADRRSSDYGRYTTRNLQTGDHIVAHLAGAKELGAWRHVIGFTCLGLFDWLQLIFLPVVIPLVVIPLVVGLRRSRESE
jgi:hypothetical protein